jgi:phosphohistidine phosphatase
MECILFRHGIAVERDDWDGEEHLRPLTPKGAEKTREAVAGLLRLELEPGYLWTSPLARAFDTAKLIRQMLCPRIELHAHEVLLPEASPDKLLALLSSLPSDATVICVGHEPHLGETAGLLLLGKPVTGLSLKKAGACCLRFRETPKAGRAELRWWMGPSQLRSLR